ncbi:MAG: metal-dependent transcriptional regulator [bacterium]|nr:metal-dependent transcriptional regulator [bacterium]
MDSVSETPELSAAQQDYLEAVYALELEDAAGEGVRVTDIAAKLATKLPTVTRTLSRLRSMGLVIQEERGPVFLSELGRHLSQQLAHRHDDVVFLLTEVLGVPQETALSEACVMEHGLSGETSERLHHWLEAWQQLEPELRQRLREAAAAESTGAFTLLGDASGSGDRA